MRELTDAWRPTTIDIDIDIDPGLDLLLREIPAIKEELRVNVELASPAHFIPELPGWRDRSPFVVREGSIDFHHYDFNAQALAKIERAHARDLEDVREMAARGLVEPARLLQFFEQVAPLSTVIQPSTRRPSAAPWSRRFRPSKPEPPRFQPSTA